MRFATILLLFLASQSSFADRLDLRFDDACTPAQTTLTMGFGGDLLMHASLQEQGARKGFESLWPELVPLFNRIDLTYLNLETPTSHLHPHSSYPQFNVSPRLLEDLVRSGVDVVSTANNHALDVGASGIDATIENLQAAGLGYFGTRPSNGSGDWFTIKTVKGLKFAFVACTYSTNGMRDSKAQVLPCFGSGGQASQTLLDVVRGLTSNPRISGVIVTPHWGTEYSHKPEARQYNLAKSLAREGVLAVIGSHPHVVQHWEKIESGGKETFVVYSNGNFVSGQGGLARRTGTFVVLGISADANRVWINGVRYVPLFMEYGNQIRVRPAENVREGKAAASLVGEHFGLERRLRVKDPLKTNPECQRIRSRLR